MRTIDQNEEIRKFVEIQSAGKGRVTFYCSGHRYWFSHISSLDAYEHHRYHSAQHLKSMDLSRRITKSPTLWYVTVQKRIK